MVQKLESSAFILEEKTEWEQLSKGVKRQILGYNKDLMMVKVAFESGIVSDPHSHPHIQVTYIASGTFKFNVGEKSSVVKAGDSVYIEPDKIHNCECIESGVLLDTFAPMREDFLK
jgi:quercetin dioxygenase-like cupin family protein